jgi:hypothetical protein
MKQNSGLQFTYEGCARLSSKSVASVDSPFFKIDLAVPSSTPPDHRERHLLLSTTRTVDLTINDDTEALGLFLQKLAGMVPAVRAYDNT